MTDHIEFQDEAHPPPMIFGTPQLPVGGIKHIDLSQNTDIGMGPVPVAGAGAAGAAAGMSTDANDVRIAFKVRDADLKRVLYARVLISRRDDFVFYPCPDLTIPPTGQLEREVEVVLTKTRLTPGECARVDIAVSGSFVRCVSDVPDAGPRVSVKLHGEILNAFDEVATPSGPNVPPEIAIASYWLWDVSMLDTNDGALKLVNSCPLR